MSGDSRVGDETTKKKKKKNKKAIIMHHSIHLGQERGAVMEMKNVVRGCGGLLVSGKVLFL